MDRLEIITTLKQYKKDYQDKHGFSKIGVFGSVVKETDAKPNDVDIVIEQKEPDLFLLGTIKADLEKMFNMRVDIIRLRNGMNAFLKNRIDQETIYV